MLLPLKDDNPLKLIPFQAVTYGLMAVNIGIFLAVQVESEAFYASFALVPNQLLGGEQADGAVPEILTLITSQFLHGGWAHIGGNMLFLWVFGDNIEDVLGHLRFLAFYLACGIAAGLTHALLAPGSGVPTIGASGAIAGIVGAYLVFFPKVKMWVLVLNRFPVKLSAYLVLGAWIAFQVFMGLTTNAESGVAWWAHIGGFVVGAGLALIVRSRGSFHHAPDTQLTGTVPVTGKWSGRL